MTIEPQATRKPARKRCGGGRLSLDVIEARLAPRGITLVSDFRKTSLPATFRGECGHFWRATAGVVINSSSTCPVCNRRRLTTRFEQEYFAIHETHACTAPSA